MRLVLCMLFEAALQLGSDSGRKFIDFALCVCELGLRMRDGTEGVFEALERGHKGQDGKLEECGLSSEGGGPHRGIWGGRLPVRGPGSGWVHRHGVA